VTGHHWRRLVVGSFGPCATAERSLGASKLLTDVVLTVLAMLSAVVTAAAYVVVHDSIYGSPNGPEPTTTIGDAAMSFLVPRDQSERSGVAGIHVCHLRKRNVQNRSTASGMRRSDFLR
jgi:hypothetical protein